MRLLNVIVWVFFRLLAYPHTHAHTYTTPCRAVQTLDNIAMANSEYAEIVTAEGGKDGIKALASLYANDEDAEELVDACNSALLSMDALVRNTEGSGGAGAPTHKRMVAIVSQQDEAVTTASHNAAMEKDRKEAEQLHAKLQGYKNSLISGKVFGVRQDRGGKKKMHILCTKDLKAFLFKSPMERGSIGHTIKFDDIRRIDYGCHVKAKARKKAGMGYFYIECVQDVRSIDVITDTSAQADFWVEALNVVLSISKKYRHLLPK